jgi:di/tripeptidase
MNFDLLKQILAVPTYSRQEQRMVEFLVAHVGQRGKERCGEIVTDCLNNVYIRKGNAGIVPCVAAHIDTVHPPRHVEIVQQDGILFGRDEQGQRTGIGGDDKAGVFVCLELLERFDHLAVALFAAEEIGCVGAIHAPTPWFKDVGYVIQTATPVLAAHGLTRWQRHPFTDVMALRQRFDFSCLNLSCGYHNWHRPDEYIVVDEVEAAVNAGEALVAALGCRSYPFTAGANDLSEPLFEVTGLQLA